MAALTIGVLAVSHQATAQTDTPLLLFGNDALSSRNLILGGVVSTSTATTSHESLAQGFVVGEIAYKIQSVDVGLYLPLNAPSLKIQLFSSTGPDNDEIPNVSLGDFDTLAPTNNGGVFTPGGIVVYNFAYKGDTVLAAGQKYWIVVSYNTTEGVEPPVFNWHYAASSTGGGTGSTAVPAEQNGSGVTYLGTLGTHDNGGQWLDHRLGTTFPHAGLRVGVWGTEAPVIIDGGGGGGVDQTPPTLDCYALSKGFFKNNFGGWPTLIATQGTVIEGQTYTVAQLQAMLSAKSTRGNQIGQLASQLVAVHLSRALAIQTAGVPYTDWWDGWAPDSAEAQAAYVQAAALINANIRFETYRGRLRVADRCATVSGVSNLISALDGYIQANHCSTSGGGGSGGSCNDDDDDDDDDRRHDGKYRGKCQGKDKQGRKCGR
jgi:hypothetical protein